MAPIKFEGENFRLATGFLRQQPQPYGGKHAGRNIEIQIIVAVDLLSYTDGLAAQWRDFVLLLGRVLLGWIFVQSGWRKLMDIPGFVATMPRRGLPEVMGYIAPPVEFIGGCSVVRRR